MFSFSDLMAFGTLIIALLALIIEIIDMKRK